MLKSREFWLVTASALLLGITGVLLSVWGNPENSGICVSCFIENSAGALGLHDNQRMQYLRPELIGFVLGSFVTALIFKDFRSRGGSATLSRLFLGIFMIFGCAVFIGCPIKLMLRFAAGDMTAVAGIVGLVAGVWAGLKGLTHGVEFVPQSQAKSHGGLLIPGLFILLLVFFLVRPGFLLFSSQGGGTQFAPWQTALLVGVLLGGLAQRSRFCITGSIRNFMLMGLRTSALPGLLIFILAALLMNILTGRFNYGLYGQPGAHLEYIWSFLGMGLVGWISVLIGGCPFRQLIKAGEGDADAGIVVIGMFIGGALAQSWGIAATASGVSIYGKLAMLAGFLLLATGSLVFRERNS
ncbi:MAG: YedE family putative selenium transporter [Desulfuromonadaceae bacterium]|nr:YedE family putative selenium transporter [Desulfuromonadaceae bacterium]MDD2856719.1 YedE family putative selenium transporter [Desulfuromonadaceae bacterium]